MPQKVDCQRVLISRISLGGNSRQWKEQSPLKATGIKGDTLFTACPSVSFEFYIVYMYFSLTE